MTPWYRNYALLAKVALYTSALAVVVALAAFIVELA